MASFNRVVFSGSVDTISVPFPFLDKSHVHVYLDGAELPSTAFSWPSNGQVKITAGAPAFGVVGIVKRITPEQPITVFSGGNLDVTDLNVASFQPIYLAEEAKDISVDGVAQVNAAISLAQAYAADAANASGLQVPIFGSKASAAGALILSGSNRLKTQFYAPLTAVPSTLVGGAEYRRSSQAEVAKKPSRAWFRSFDGAYWLLDEDEPWAGQLGAIADGAVLAGATDNSAALQALLDYHVPSSQVPAFDRPSAMAGGGVVKLEPGVFYHKSTLYGSAFVRIQGSGMAMFPQAPLDGSSSGQQSFPNATILRPDLALADRATGVGLHITPWVLSLTGASAGMAGQTVGTRFKSILPTEISGTDIDNGCVSYCEGADIRDLTVWPVNEIFAGIRWTAAAKSNIRRVGVRNVRRGIMLESCWESSIKGCGIYDFGDYGIYGGGNLHGFSIMDNWIHAGGRVLAGDKPTGIFADFFMGLIIDANAIDECWNAIYLHAGTGCSINGNHCERTSNIWLLTQGAYGVKGEGNSAIYNVVDARTYGNSILWDGVDCDVEINIIATTAGQGSGLTFPGKTYLVGINPNTGQATSLSFANGAGVHTTAIFKSMPKLAGDAGRVNRTAGRIAFEFESNVIEIAGFVNNNGSADDLNIYGDTGVGYSRSVYVNGVAAGYMTITADGWQWHDETGALVLGWSTTLNRVLFAGGLTLQSVFGGPETFRTEPKGSLVTDTFASGLYIKGTDGTVATGWRSLGDVDQEVTSTNLGSAAHAINTTNKRKGALIYNTTNTHVYRALGSGATSAWVSLRDGTTITPA
jgi:hypothetical protein